VSICITRGIKISVESRYPLRTEFGILRGSYGMVRPNGEIFEAKIAPFALLPSYMLN
jgi:uncharacterized protein affecting Mg2+/Co2+ transport